VNECVFKKGKGNVCRDERKMCRGGELVMVGVSDRGGQWYV